MVYVLNMDGLSRHASVFYTKVLPILRVSRWLGIIETPNVQQSFFPTAKPPLRLSDVFQVGQCTEQSRRPGLGIRSWEHWREWSDQRGAANFRWRSGEIKARHAQMHVGLRRVYWLHYLSSGDKATIHRRFLWNGPVLVRASQATDVRRSILREPLGISKEFPTLESKICYVSGTPQALNISADSIPFCPFEALTT